MGCFKIKEQMKSRTRDGSEIRYAVGSLSEDLYTGFVGGISKSVAKVNGTPIMFMQKNAGFFETVQ